MLRVIVRDRDRVRVRARVRFKVSVIRDRIRGLSEVTGLLFLRPVITRWRLWALILKVRVVELGCRVRVDVTVTFIVK